MGMPFRHSFSETARVHAFSPASSGCGIKQKPAKGDVGMMPGARRIAVGSTIPAGCRAEGTQGLLRFLPSPANEL